MNTSLGHTQTSLPTSGDNSVDRRNFLETENIFRRAIIYARMENRGQKMLSEKAKSKFLADRSKVLSTLKTTISIESLYKKYASIYRMAMADALYIAIANNADEVVIDALKARLSEVGLKIKRDKS